MSSFSFMKSALGKSAAEYENVVLSKDMRKILVAIADIIAQHIEIMPLALRGFLLKAIRNVQQDLKIMAADLPYLSSSQRDEFVNKAYEYCENNLKKILINGTEDDLSRLHKGLIKACDLTKIELEKMAK